MMLHLAWFGVGVLTTLTAVTLVLLEAEHRLNRTFRARHMADAPADDDINQGLIRALAEWDARFQVMQPPLASGIKGFDQTGRRLH